MQTASSSELSMHRHCCTASLDDEDDIALRCSGILDRDKQRCPTLDTVPAVYPMSDSHGTEACGRYLAGVARKYCSGDICIPVGVFLYVPFENVTEK